MGLVSNDLPIIPSPDLSGIANSPENPPMATQPAIDEAIIQDPVHGNVTPSTATEAQALSGPQLVLVSRPSGSDILLTYEILSELLGAHWFLGDFVNLEGKSLVIGQVVVNDNKLYRVTTSHTASDTFLSGNFQQLTSSGGVTDLSIGAITTTTIDIDNDNGTGVTIPQATNSEAGLMSSSDFTKLENIGAVGDMYTKGPVLPDATTNDLHILLGHAGDLPDGLYLSNGTTWAAV